MRRTVRTCVAVGGVMAATMSIGILSARVTLAPQAAGPACIAIVTPVVQGVPGSAVDAAAGVRDLMSGYLRGPKLKVVALETRLQSQAIEEAKEKHFEPLLFVTVTHKAGNKGLLKALGKGAGVASIFVPGGGTLAAASARTATSAGLQTASALAASTKAKGSGSPRIPVAVGFGTGAVRTEDRRADGVSRRRRLVDANRDASGRSDRHAEERQVR
jgi:hypothetical protein